MNSVDRVKNLCKERKIAISKLEKDCGFANGYISQLRKGVFPTDRLIVISKYLNVTPEFLIYGTEKKPSPDAGEGSARSRYYVPVLGYVRAGIPLDAIEEILDYEEISEDMARQGEHFGLRIKGDSMEPRMKEGDVVIVRRQESVDNGDVAVVLVNGNDATIKKFYKSAAGVSLISFNPNYAPFTFSPKEVEDLPVRVIGKVVELRAKF